MEEINKMALIQENISKEMDRMFSNMKKDSPSTRNLLYLDQKSAHLEKLMEHANKKHESIAQLNISSHDYPRDIFCFRSISRAFLVIKAGC